MKNPLAIEFSDKRVYGLDILRALAIIFVIFAHGAKILPERLVKFHDYFFVDGVFLFFVLSGFLIGGILIKILDNKKATSRNLLNFWVRRWFRTLPNFFLILSILIAIRYLFYGGLPDVNVAQYYLFLQNFSYPHPGFFSEAWTLAVEEWFYLLVPALLFSLIGVFKMAPKRAVLVTIVAVASASIGVRLYRYAIHPPTTIAEWDLYFRKEVITRLDSLMFGVLGAYLAYYYKALWIRHKVALFWGGLGIVAAQQIVSIYIASGSRMAEAGFGFYISVVSFTITALGILMLMPLLSQIKSGSGLIFTSLTYVSIISYSMYLIHVSLIQPLVFSVTDVRTTHLIILLRYGLYWSLTILCSILLYKYFERPTTNLRENIVRKRAKRSDNPETSPAPADVV